jgi:hypothetical protein
MDLQREIVAATGAWDIGTAFTEIEETLGPAIEHPNIFDCPRVTVSGVPSPYRPAASASDYLHASWSDSTRARPTASSKPPKK